MILQKHTAIQCLSLICAGLILTQCGDSTREKLGLGRQAPDEFDVAKQEPLEMPPDYNLRPPQPGAERPQEQKAAEKAREKLVGQAGNNKRADLSPAESALLDMAGADKANPDIRRIVNRETANRKAENRPVADRLFNWGSTIEPATLVDAPAEMERLRKNKENDRSSTAGETPKIEQ